MATRRAPGTGLLVALVLVLAALLRLWGVGHDLPLDVERTQAPALDAFWYLEAAQAPADGSHVEALPSYDRPLWVALARGWFALAGTGIESAERLGALLGVLGVLGVFLALRRESPRAALVAALLLATSYPFACLARTPLIYTPLASFLALVLALHAREERRARALAWALLLVLAGGFKGVALVLAPGLALSDLARTGRRSRVLVLLGGALVVGAGLVLIARLEPDELLRNRERIERYLAPGLGPASWSRLVLAPVESGLLALAPGLSGLAAIGATRWRRRKGGSLDPLVLAAVGWVATLVFGLALSEYRPLRFYALAGPPVAVLAGKGVEALLRGGTGHRKAPLVAGLVLANAWALVASLRGASAPVLALAAPLGVGAALLVSFVPLPRLALGRPLAVSVVVLTLLLDLGGDLARTPTTLVTANRTARETLGPHAVLAGPYASSLAAGARGLERRRAPGLTGGPRAASGLALARREGFTHVALDARQDYSGQLSAGFGEQGEPPVLLLALPLRSSELLLVYRLHAAREAGYELSPVEEAFEAKDAPSALRALGASAALVEARARALARLGRLDDAKALMPGLLK